MLFFIIFNKFATNDVKELRTPLLTIENLDFRQVALKITGHLAASVFFLSLLSSPIFLLVVKLPHINP